jgi:hypothetical protein
MKKIREAKARFTGISDGPVYDEYRNRFYQQIKVKLLLDSKEYSFPYFDVSSEKNSNVEFDPEKDKIIKDLFNDVFGSSDSGKNSMIYNELLIQVLIYENEVIAIGNISADRWLKIDSLLIKSKAEIEMEYKNPNILSTVISYLRMAS